MCIMYSLYICSSHLYMTLAVKKGCKTPTTYQWNKGWFWVDMHRLIKQLWIDFQIENNIWIFYAGNRSQRNLSCHSHKFYGHICDNFDEISQIRQILTFSTGRITLKTPMRGIAALWPIILYIYIYAPACNYSVIGQVDITRKNRWGHS